MKAQTVPDARGLVPAISMRVAQCLTIEIAGTSPAMTCEP
jgi:hypothetical protein